VSSWPTTSSRLADASARSAPGPSLCCFRSAQGQIDSAVLHLPLAPPLVVHPQALSPVLPALCLGRGWLSSLCLLPSRINPFTTLSSPPSRHHPHFCPSHSFSHSSSFVPSIHHLPHHRPPPIESVRHTNGLDFLSSSTSFRFDEAPRQALRLHSAKLDQDLRFLLTRQRGPFYYGCQGFRLLIRNVFVVTTVDLRASLSKKSATHRPSRSATLPFRYNV
jgi:hypothetical protein